MSYKMVSRNTLNIYQICEVDKIKMFMLKQFVKIISEMIQVRPAKLFVQYNQADK